MGGALGLRAARCEPFGRGLSGAAREQPATVGVGPARTVGGVLWGPRATRTANGRGVRPPGSGTRLEPSSADRPHQVSSSLAHRAASRLAGQDFTQNASHQEYQMRISDIRITALAFV